MITNPVRITDPETGGQKEQKDVQLSMLPVGFIEDLGRVYAMGAAKYSRDNWRRGYAWHLSYDAMLRHILASMRGEWFDSGSGLPHLVHAVWHCATLHTFYREGLGTDDRFTEASINTPEQPNERLGGGPGTGSAVGSFLGWPDETKHIQAAYDLKIPDDCYSGEYDC